MRSGQYLPVAAGILIAALVIVLLFGFPVPSSRSSGGPSPLPAAEVRSYEGKDLSSVNDFHENSISGPQYVNGSEYRLTVTGLVNTTDIYTYEQVLITYPHYSKVVTLFCVEGWDATILWEGVLVRDLIRHAGPDPRANTVIFTAHDGYTTSFPLSYIMDRNILMACRMNNVTLPAERGYPFQLVAEDKWGYKWIKWIEKIELTADPSYKGYWEQRGTRTPGTLTKTIPAPDNSHQSISRGYDLENFMSFFWFFMRYPLSRQAPFWSSPVSRTGSATGAWRREG